MMPAFNTTQLTARTSLSTWTDPLQQPALKAAAEAIIAALRKASAPLTAKQLHLEHRCGKDRQTCDKVVTLLHERGDIERVKTTSPYTYSVPRL
jgi:hypothetical protein